MLYTRAILLIVLVLLLAGGLRLHQFFKERNAPQQVASVIKSDINVTARA